MNEKTRSRLFAVIVPIATCLLFVAALELGLATFYPSPFSIEQNMFYEADPFTGFRHKPHGRGFYQNGIPGNANSLGLRDVETTIEKPDGTYRILVIGDSFTAGTNVRQEDAYPKVLERILRARYDQRIEVINAGVGSYNPPQYEAWFKHYGRHFNPDLIIVRFFVGNDTFDPVTWLTAVMGHRVSVEAAQSALIKLKVVLYDHSHIARLLLNRGPVNENFLRRKCDDFTDWYIEIQRARIDNHLRDSEERRAIAQDSIERIRSIRAMAAPIPVLVALLPDENQLNSNLQARLVPPEQMARYDFAMPQSMLHELIDPPLIDLLPDFRRDPRCLYMNDTHWTEEGHDLAASEIADQLAPYLQGR